MTSPDRTLAAPRPDASPGPDSGRLGAGMKSRHLVMMSLGSAIGAGLFVGSGAGIAVAGPAVLLSYAIAAVVVIVVMRALGEMAAMSPSSGAFSVYTERALGPAAGFAVGWVWWLLMCLVVAAEATAAAQLVHGMWPAAPQWALTLLFLAVFTGINLWGADKFGEFEFWFSMLKVGAVVAFLLLGVAFLLGGTPGDSPGLSNLTAHGGFMPKGLAGVAAGLLVVAFAFGGVEIVAIAAAETDDPARNVKRAINTIILRILVFYMGSVAIMVAAVPWTSKALVESPFVAVLDAAGLPALGKVLGIVVVIALLSSLNANLYGASRMIFSLSERGLAPAALSRVTRNRVPMAALLASVVFGLIVVACNYVWADKVLGVLLNIVGSSLVVTWIATLVSHLILRRRAERDGTPMPMRSAGFPVLDWVALAIAAGIIVLGMTNPEVRAQLLGTAAVVGALLVLGALVRRRPTA